MMNATDEQTETLKAMSAMLVGAGALALGLAGFEFGPTSSIEVIEQIGPKPFGQVLYDIRYPATGGGFLLLTAGIGSLVYRVMNARRSIKNDGD